MIQKQSQATLKFLGFFSVPKFQWNVQILTTSLLHDLGASWAKNTSGFKVYDMSFPMDLECSVHAFLKHPLHAFLLYHCRPPSLQMCLIISLFAIVGLGKLQHAVFSALSQCFTIYLFVPFHQHYHQHCHSFHPQQLVLDQHHHVHPSN